MDSAAVTTRMSYIQRHDDSVASQDDHCHQHQQQRRQQSQQKVRQPASAGPFNHFFTSGAYLSPSCTRIGLASSSSTAAPLASDQSHYYQLEEQQQFHNQSRVSAEANPQLSTQHNQRAFSKLSGHTGPPHTNQSLSKGSFFRPILSLLAATASVSNLETLKHHDIAGDTDQLDDSERYDDLPSPIYNHDSSDDGEEESYGSKLPRSVFLDLGSSHLDLTKEDDRDQSSEAPLPNLQERGYTVAKERAKIDRFEEQKSVLSISTQSTTYLRFREPMTEEQRNELVEGSPVLMSATLSTRYWEASASVGSFEDVEQLKTKGVKVLGIESKAKLNSEMQQGSMVGSKGLVPTELMQMEYQNEQERDAVTKACHFDANDDDDQETSIIYIDFDRLLQICAEVDQGGERERGPERRLLWNRVQQLNLYGELEQEREQDEIASNFEESSFNIHINNPCVMSSQQVTSAILGALNVTTESIDTSVLKRVQFDPCLQIIACFEVPSSENTSPENQHEDAAPSGNNSPGWIPMRAFEPELVFYSKKNRHGILNLECEASSLDTGHLSSPISLPGSLSIENRAVSQNLIETFTPDHLLPPLPDSPLLDQSPPPRSSIITCASPSIRASISTGLLSARTERTSPRTLELATARMQLLYWKQAAARLHDQEYLLTNRIDQLVQEMADMLERCQNTEIGLQAKECTVQELNQELIKEKVFGFASIQEAVLSIHEKQVLEHRLEESWQELETLHMELEQTRACQLPKQPQPQPQQLFTTCAISNSREWQVRGHSAPFQVLIKYLYLMLLSTVTIAVAVHLLYKHQYQLHQAYRYFATSANRLTNHLLLVKVGLENPQCWVRGPAAGFRNLWSSVLARCERS
ncbi:hypothetical protein BGZ54_007846 [Gamsiella multidivaricata]|nr:hypothetical protein BGZ54_007846 [Gamsiella multidivaricata]